MFPILSSFAGSRWLKISDDYQYINYQHMFFFRIIYTTIAGPTLKVSERSQRFRATLATLPWKTQKAWRKVLAIENVPFFEPCRGVVEVAATFQRSFRDFQNHFVYLQIDCLNIKQTAANKQKIIYSALLQKLKRTIDFPMLYKVLIASIHVLHKKICSDKRRNLILDRSINLSLAFLQG